MAAERPVKALKIKVFGSARHNPFRHIDVKATTGAPGARNGKVGTLCWNTYDGDAYICTVADTTWVKLNA